MERLIGTALAATAVVAVTLVLKASVIAWNLWFVHARPALGDRIYAAYTGSPRWATVLGLTNTAAVLFLAMILFQFEPLGLIALVLLAGLCAAHLWGRSACYRAMAVRLHPDGKAPSTRAFVQGGIVVECAFLVPVLGQLLYLGVTMRCAGAFVMALLASRRESPPV